MTESLLHRSEGSVRFDSDQEPSLEIGEFVEVDEERVDLILRENIVHLELALIILITMS